MKRIMFGGSTSGCALHLARGASFALCALASLAAVLAICVPTRAAESRRDPGLILELDREHYQLRTRDAGRGSAGPSFRVVLGSPAHDTPSGDYAIGRVILNPAWHPSDEALAAGAQPLPPSLDGPMGVAKIPFADRGSIALHGGGDALLLGKPVSGGCVRARDSDLLRVIAWFAAQGALGPVEVNEEGEVLRDLVRPVRLRVR